MTAEGIRAAPRSWMAASAVDGASNMAVNNSVMCSLPSQSSAYVEAKRSRRWEVHVARWKGSAGHADVIFSHETEAPHGRSHPPDGRHRSRAAQGATRV